MHNRTAVVTNYILGSEANHAGVRYLRYAAVRLLPEQQQPVQELAQADSPPHSLVLTLTSTATHEACRASNRSC